LKALPEKLINQGRQCLAPACGQAFEFYEALFIDHQSGSGHMKSHTMKSSLCATGSLVSSWQQFTCGRRQVYDEVARIPQGGGQPSLMDLYEAIRWLCEEKKRVERLIASLERLQQSGQLGPEGRVRKRQGRRRMSAQERARVSARMKQYWALRKSQDAVTRP
jgi:hypothetical protein